MDGTADAGDAADTGADDTSLLNQEDDKSPPAGAPEKYEAFTLPDGVSLVPEAVEEINTLFKSLNLTQEAGQKLMDYYVTKTLEAADAPYQLWADTRKQWQDAVKADPELGPNLSKVKASVSRLIDSLGEDLGGKFREAMDFTGAGDNPAFIKAFYKLAERLTEGGHVSGGKPAGQDTPGSKPASAAAALYPNLVKGS